MLAAPNRRGNSPARGRRTDRRARGRNGPVPAMTDSIPRLQFNPPPGWPTPPPGWSPPAGWQGPSSWPPAPAGWQYWIEPSYGVGISRDPSASAAGSFLGDAVGSVDDPALDPESRRPRRRPCARHRARGSRIVEHDLCRRSERIWGRASVIGSQLRFAVPGRSTRTRLRPESESGGPGHERTCS